MTQRVIIAGPTLPELNPEDEQAWRAWFTRYGIDVNNVPTVFPIECDDDANTITYTEWCRASNGRRVYQGDDQGLRKVLRQVKLGEPAAPCPSGWRVFVREVDDGSLPFAAEELPVGGGVQ